MHGRSSLMESLVWLIPFLCVKRKEKEERRSKTRDKMKREREVNKFFFEKCFKTPKSAR